MYKKYLIRSRAVAIACVLAFTTMACGTATGSNTSTSAVSAEASSQETASQKSESDTLQSTMSKGTFGNSSNDTDKEETVYVAGDATGAQDKVTVSDWLKNEDGNKTIKDETSLQDVTNVKGNEDFVKNSDGTITWNADGNDIYYQGTSSQQLPVNVKVSYKLDGKDIKPEDLAGKSGKVTIRFDYTNNDKKTVDINGKSEEIYTPFAMVSGVMLPTDKFSNVQVSSGKVISDANDYIVMGVGLPGLKDSLKLDEDKLKDIELTDKNVNIPDYVEITADTNDFQLGMTMTMATSDALSDLGFTDLDNSEKVDDVNSKIDNMTDGVNKLQDGSESLQTGTGKLYDGTKKLTNGTYKLANGAGKLTDGATTLKDGSGKLGSGASDLQKGISDYTGGVAKVADGAAQLDNGVSALQSGVGSLQSGAGTLADGINSAYSGSSTLKGGTGTALTGAASLKDGTAALQAGVNQMVNTMYSEFYAVEISKQVLNAMLPESNAKSTMDTVMAQAAQTPSGTATKTVTQNTPILTMSSDKTSEKQENTKYTVNFDSNGGSTVESETVEADKDGNYIVKEPDAPARDGYTFEGWYTDETDENGSGDQFDFSKGITSDTDLYAAWKENEKTSYTVTYMDNDTSAGTATVEDGSTATKPEDPTKDRYTFSGWYTEKDDSGNGTGDPFDFETAITGDLTLYAGWSPSQARADYVTSPVILFAGEDKLLTKDLYTQLSGALGSKIGSQTGTDAAGAISDVDTYTGGKVSEILTMTTGHSVSDWKKYAASYYDYMSKAKAAGDAASAQSAMTAGAIPAGIFYTAENGLDIQETSLSGSQKDLDTLNAGAGKLTDGAAQLYTGLGQLDSGAGTLNSGLSQLAGGGTTLVNGVQTLSNGVSSLKNGSSQLAGGINTLNSNSAKLNSGAADLATGMVTLDNGVSDLLNGTVTLGNGINDLGSGAKTLQSGAKKVNNGAGDLADGIVKFNDEGVSKISEAFDGDIRSFSDRLQAVNQASEDYTSFGGAASDQKSTVKFFFKTAGITTDEDSSNS